MKVKRWAMVVFLVGVLCMTIAIRLHAAAAAFQCEAYCTYICGCNGQGAWAFNDCCGVCYNPNTGGSPYLWCCSGTCGN